jgi:DNA-directed RNA polymerase specialized sigma24 family protein
MPARRRSIEPEETAVPPELVEAKAPEPAATSGSGAVAETERLKDLLVKAATLYKTLEPRLARMVQGRIPPRLQGRIDVEDVLQSGFRRLLKNLTSGGAVLDRLVCQGEDVDKVLQAWIFKKVWSQWQDERRKFETSARDLNREVGLPEGSVLALVTRIGLSTHLGLKETLDLIRGKLTPEDFDIVWWRIVDELSYPEIALILDKTPDAVRKRYTRLLLKIREVVDSPFSSATKPWPK